MLLRSKFKVSYFNCKVERHDLAAHICIDIAMKEDNFIIMFLFKNFPTFSFLGRRSLIESLENQKKKEDAKSNTV